MFLEQNVIYLSNFVRYLVVTDNYDGHSSKQNY